ncbi:TerB family tellurite resistance protein [Hymenobacter monticola]|uniref:TerB family tellurite resistance protein n=1 Tax=Hymenobacter monticola TaxID=1705399 RepID=A0ABY4B643_9BACT|nr:TerB family tellurite resistance protein [Hymenobacter monticola]UOE34641.1 TerB family tellurite resistance protein [Hymenobacter monticola]
MDTQLLQNYSEQEKTAYLSAIASLATADRQASQAEGQFLQALCQQAGLSESSTQQVAAAAQNASNEGIQQNLDALKSSDLRFSLVTDLISFARADGSYANDEEAMISKMAQYLGINPEQKQALETVVDQAATVAHDPQDPAKQGFFDRIGDKLSNVGIPKTALMTGLLGVVAPMVISRVMSGGSHNQGYGNQGGGGLLGGLGGGGSLGGLLGGAASTGLGGMLGGLLGGGMLGGLMGGGNQAANYPQQGSAIGNGGLGSMMSILGGLGGRPNSQPASAGGSGLGGLLGSSSLGGMLGGLFGGR